MDAVYAGGFPMAPASKRKTSLSLDAARGRGGAAPALAGGERGGLRRAGRVACAKRASPGRHSRDAGGRDLEAPRRFDIAEHGEAAMVVGKSDLSPPAPAVVVISLLSGYPASRERAGLTRSRSSGLRAAGPAGDG